MSFSNDKKRTTHLGDLFENRKKILHVADLFLIHENQRIVEDDFHLFGVGYEIGGDVPAIELHAFDHFQCGLHALRLFDRDNAFLAYLVHRFGDDISDGGIVIGGNGSDLGDFLLVLGRLADLLQFVDDDLNGLFDAALEGHRIGAGGHELGTFIIDGLCQDGGGGRSVAGHVTGLAGDFLHHLCAHVLELVFQFDFLRHGNAVLGHGGTAEGFFDDHVTALGAQGYLHCVGKGIDTLEQGFACFYVIDQLLRHEAFLPFIFPLHDIEVVFSKSFNNGENIIFPHDQEFDRLPP